MGEKMTRGGEKKQEHGIGINIHFMLLQHHRHCTIYRYNNSIRGWERISGYYGEFSHLDADDACEVFILFIYLIPTPTPPPLITLVQNHNSAPALRGINVFLGQYTFLECSCFALILAKTQKKTAHSDMFSVIMKQWIMKHPPACDD